MHWNGHCWYSSSNDRLTFEAAEEACREVNGHASLASIHQQWDNRFLSGQTKSELKLLVIDCMLILIRVLFVACIATKLIIFKYLVAKLQ